MACEFLKGQTKRGQAEGERGKRGKGQKREEIKIEG